MRVLGPLFAALLATSVAIPAAAYAADTAPLLAEATTAEQVGAGVRDLYERYFAALTAMAAQADGQMPPEFEWTAIADRYFTPELATRFKKAIASDEPVIDWDFLADGQDVGELKVIGSKSIKAGETVTVTMTTSNFGRQSQSKVLLIQTATGWRITDLEFWPGTPEATTLTNILKEAGF